MHQSSLAIYSTLASGFPFGTAAMLRAVLLVIVRSIPALAQIQPAEEYYQLLPPHGRLTEQTKANIRFRLYQDKTDSTASEIPGMGRQRYDRLNELAQRFSPTLHPTNYSVPRDFEDVLAFGFDPQKGAVHCASGVPLYVDRWRVSGPVPARESTSSIDLGVTNSPEPCTGGRQPSAQADDTLLKLLKELGPRVPRQDEVSDSLALRWRRIRQQSDTVLYFDFPGSARYSWRDVYNQLAGLRSRIYAHPFIQGHESVPGSTRYEFVMQYWLFYPFNDAVNNHEGDWEHLNVSISTRTRMTDSAGVARLLSEEDIDRILSDSSGASDDDLVISAVDYYFHSSVVTVDYKPVYDTLQRRFQDILADQQLAERFGQLSATAGPEVMRLPSSACPNKRSSML